MVYFIKYTLQDNTDVLLFDIDYYLKEDEDTNASQWNDRQWFSEINPISCIGGITHFLKEKFQEPNFDCEDFINDAHQIEELRGLLYETYNNQPKSYEDAQQFHYNIFGVKLKQILNDFCDKWGFYLDID